MNNNSHTTADLKSDAEQPNKNISNQESDTINEHKGLHAAVVYEIIRVQGEHELVRQPSALWWSGLAAGLSIGFSVLAEAFLRANLPDEPWRPIVDNLGYSVGFLIVILAHQQLFTENTLTAVLPVIKRKKWRWVYALMKLWTTVLVANVIGCILFALSLIYLPVLSGDVQVAVFEISKHMMENTAFEMFAKGIFAGWLIAALVWILPSAEGSKFLIITLLTYLIALGDFTHIIAGSAEAFYLLFVGEIGLFDVVFRFFIPTLLGNVVGGTALFAVLSYAQVKEEI